MAGLLGGGSPRLGAVAVAVATLFMAGCSSGGPSGDAAGEASAAPTENADGLIAATVGNPEVATAAAGDFDDPQVPDVTSSASIALDMAQDLDPGAEAMLSELAIAQEEAFAGFQEKLQVRTDKAIKADQKQEQRTDTAYATTVEGATWSSAAGSVGAAPALFIRAADAPTNWTSIGEIMAFGGMLAQEVPVGPSNEFRDSAKEGKSTSELGMEFGREADGRLTVGISADGKSSGEVDGKAASTSVGSKLRTVGSPCPDASGRVEVEFLVKLGADVRSGTQGGAATQEVSGTAKANVNDAAWMDSIEFDIRQQTAKPNASGQPTFSDSSEAWRMGIDGPNGVWTSAQGVRAPSVNRKSQNTARSDAQKYHDDGMARGRELATGYLKTLEAWWRDGRCVQVLAKSPGSVEPASRTDIKVSVQHKIDKADLSAPVDATLTGPESIDPQRIDAAPGTITYVAPDTRKKTTATIALVSTSKRGIGKKDLTATTGAQAYKAEGGADDFQGTGTICDLAQPFTISGGGVTQSFTPSSEKGGSYSYKGSLQGFKVNGKGTYTVKADESGGSITATGRGSVKTPLGTFSNDGTETYTLTPIDSCE